MQMNCIDKIIISVCLIYKKNIFLALCIYTSPGKSYIILYKIIVKTLQRFECTTKVCTNRRLIDGFVRNTTEWCVPKH